MTLDQAVEYALSPREPAAHPAPAPEHRPSDGSGDGLTRREREVAGLIARGFTNRQIATELVITEGTAANHVEHILSKLGFRSRSQIAAWAVERGLHTPSAN